GGARLYIFGQVCHHLLGGFEDERPYEVEIQSVLVKHICSNSVKMISEIAGQYGGYMQRKPLFRIAAEDPIRETACQCLQPLENCLLRCLDRQRDFGKIDRLSLRKGLEGIQHTVDCCVGCQYGHIDAPRGMDDHTLHAFKLRGDGINGVVFNGNDIRIGLFVYPCQVGCGLSPQHLSECPCMGFGAAIDLPDTMTCTDERPPQVGCHIAAAKQDDIHHAF